MAKSQQRGVPLSNLPFTAQMNGKIQRAGWVKLDAPRNRKERRKMAKKNHKPQF